MRRCWNERVGSSVAPSIRTVIRGAACVALLAASAAHAQTNLNGGLQSVSWTDGCGTAKLFKNNTKLPMAGLWVGIGNDGTTNPPEIRDILCTNQAATKIWDVDDNEDFDNNDASEGDAVDSSPLVLTTGWHRVQARTGADFFAHLENFTLKLCDDVGGSLSGRTIFLIPMTSQAGQVGGDLSKRTELPFSVSEALPSASVTIEGFNAPPGSTSFAVGVTNSDAQKSLRKLQINPPGTTSIVAATASRGGVYDPPTRTIIWPTPIPATESVRVNVTLSSVARGLSTTIGFVGIEFVTSGGGSQPVPAMPVWSLALLVLGALLGGFLVLKRKV